jgi:hypothetical protein
VLASIPNAPGVKLLVFNDAKWFQNIFLASQNITIRPQAETQPSREQALDLTFKCAARLQK